MADLYNLDIDKVNMLEKLIYDKDLLKLAAESNICAIWYFDLQTNTLLYSKHWKELIGDGNYAVDDIHNVIDEWVHPDDRERLHISIQKYLSKELPDYENKFRLLCKDGSYKWLLSTGKAIKYSEDGKPLKVIGVHTDITNFMHIQQSAKENFEKFKNVFDYSPIAIGLLDSEGNIIDANKACFDMLGVFSLEEIKGKNIFSGPNFPRDKVNALNEGKSERFELKYDFDLAKAANFCKTTKSGSLVIDCLITPLFNDKGLITGYMGHIQDITKRTTAERSLKYSERKLRTLLDSLDAQIFTTDSDGMITGTYGQWYEKNQQDRDLIFGGTARQILGELELGLHNEVGEKLLSGKNVQFTWDTVLNGKKVYYQTSLTPILNEKDEVEEIIGIGVDITKPVEAESNYKNLVEGTLVGVYLYQDDKVVYANQCFEEIFGYDNNEVVDKRIEELIYPEDFPLVIEKFGGLKNNIKEITSEFRIVKADGSIAYVQSQASVTYYNGAPAAVGTLLDITDQKKSKDQINHMAFYDSLTNLPNRHFLNDHLKESLKLFDSNKRTGIMFIDLDRFKIINDTLGHNFGDMVLKEASIRLCKCVRKNDIVSRYGGDEFIILLSNVSKETIIDVAKRIINEFSSPFKIHGREVFTSPSIGISLYPIDSQDIDTLIKYADTAMYLAKTQGKNQFKFYTDDLNKSISREMELENGLRKALESNEFLLHYQPQIELSTGRIIGVEALIRWQHPELGVVAPMEFIPIAEETGLIVPIGKWVLERACHQMIAWKKEGLPDIKLAVNVSSRQIQKEDFVEMVDSVLQRTGLQPQLLEIEITESAIKDVKVMSSVLNKLKDLGVKSSIDDFGTGYSSLSILQHLTADSLKIEHSFVNDIATNPKTALIVETIIHMAKGLNLDVIAENIENKEQLSVLKQYNCKFGQGYLFSRPVPPEELASKLNCGSIALDRALL